MRYGVLLFIVLLNYACQKEQGGTYPEKSRLVSSVYASVTIQPDSVYQIYATVAGILDKHLVEEGDLVSKGTPVLQILDRTPKLNSENARLAFQQSRENYQGNTALLKTIDDEIEAAALKLQNDSINFKRQKRLWNQNIGSKAEYDNRKLTYELSQNKLKQLKASYDRTKNDLEIKLAQAKNNYKSAKILTEDYILTSRLDGKLYALFKEPGELVNTMEPLGIIGSANRFNIEMLIDEVDIIKVELGQKVIITLDAYPSQVFSAQVTKIYPQKEKQSQTFKIEAVFTDGPDKLYPGLAGEANIIIAVKEDALTIPIEYLIDGNLVKTENGIKEVDVGLQNLDRAEIQSGLTENDAILKPVK